MVGIDGLDALMIHHNFELVVASQDIVPFVVNARSLDDSIIDIMAYALVIILDLIMVRVVIDGHITVMFQLVVLQPDSSKQVKGNETALQLLHHGLALGMSA